MTILTLVVLHVLLSTAGYVGLIAGSAYLLFLMNGGNAPAIQAALGAWDRTTRIFGPMLGLGILCGFALAGFAHVPLTSAWLVAVYLLILAAIAMQALLVVPWRLRSQNLLAAGATVTTAPLQTMLVTQTCVYTAIVVLMIVRPG